MVAVEPLLETVVDQLEPPSDDLSILYPVIGEPPLFDGAVQLRLICDVEVAVAVSAVGDCGAVFVLVVVVVIVVVDGTMPSMPVNN